MFVCVSVSVCVCVCMCVCVCVCVCDPASARWKRIMDCCDDGLLSKAIDWKGQFNPGYHDDEPQDSEDEF